MNTFLMTATATLVAAAAIVTSSAPADAGRLRFRAHHGYIARPLVVAPAPLVVRRAPVVVVPAPIVVAPQGNWAAHVSYCSEKYVSYNPSTNTYVSNSGQVRYCDSPYT